MSPDAAFAMKKCPYCGREYSDEISICALDHTPLPSVNLIADRPSSGSNDGKTEATPSAPKPLENKLFRLTIIIYAILLIVSFGPLVGLIVSIPFFCTGLLWCYSGLLAVFITLPIAFVLAKRRGKTLIDATLSSFRWSVIVFGALGLMMWASVFVIPGYKTFTLGYWIHAKIWLDEGQVRYWAASQKGSRDMDETIPYDQWPSSMRAASMGYGSLRVDPNTKVVTLDDGGGFGHWGIVVAQKGSPPSFGSYAILLQDGAWVWHDTH
ncbi:MAG TPA: hypothetical protein VN048_10025 [Verrucomicrobiae bacterium]|nr:hypothetical protein [Verrucomicrobiae bacterium]